MIVKFYQLAKYEIEDAIEYYEIQFFGLGKRTYIVLERKVNKASNYGDKLKKMFNENKKKACQKLKNMV